MRFHIAPLILIAVLTLDVITAYPGRSRDQFGVEKTAAASDKEMAPHCRVVRHVASVFSHLRSRSPGRPRKNKSKKGQKTPSAEPVSQVNEQAALPSTVELEDSTESSTEADVKSGGEGKEETSEEVSEMPGASDAESSSLDEGPHVVATSSHDATSSDDVSETLAPIPDAQLPEETSKAYTKSFEELLLVCDGPEGKYILKKDDDSLTKPPVTHEYTMHEWAYEACPDHVAKPFDLEKVNGVYQFKVQYSPAGDMAQLFDDMYKEKKATVEDYRVLFYHMAQALACVHNAKYAHLDPRPDSFLLYHDANKGPFSTVADKIAAIKNGDIRLLLTNFGHAISTDASHNITLDPVTPLIDAPEVIFGEAIPQYTANSADVFGLGTVFWYVTDGRYAPKGSPEEILNLRREEHDVMPPIDEMQLFKGEYPRELYDVIVAMTADDSNDRDTLANFLKYHDFFRPLSKPRKDSQLEQSEQSESSEQ